VERLGSISIDLDTLPHYCRIHGLPEALLDGPTRAKVWTLALPRLLTAIEAVGARATLFVIGEDLADPLAADALRRAYQAGHELASHSHTHAYALSRLSPEAIGEELDLAQEAIAQVTGERPWGFRAPGYTLSAELVRALIARGYRYDASTFPAVPYYAAKALVMGALSLLGRPSKAILDRPRVLLAPCTPYRPSEDEPYRRGQAPLLELPIAVAPVTRVPFIGTLVTSAPGWVSRAVLASLSRRRFVDLELHAVDALGGDDGLPEALLRQQRDLRPKFARKMARLTQIFELLARRRKMIRLGDAAQRLAAEA
jgi:peptidoglycan/xylan/chitin deacetylase (PgdA/CDA1 family)